MDKYPFELFESLAVARLIGILIFSDGEVDRQESDFFEQMLQSLNISSEDYEYSLSEPIDHSYEIVKSMSAKKRQLCVKLFRQTVNSDKVIELSELSRLNEILEKTEIFRPDKENLKKTEEGFVSY